MFLRLPVLGAICGALLSACGGDGAGGGTAQSIDFQYPGVRYLADAPAPLSATASSGLAVTLSSNTPSICTISGTNSLVPVSAGECQISATQAGNGSFAAATPMQQLFKVLAHPQTITFPSPGFLALGAQPTTMTATSDSGLAIVYTTTTPTVCTVSGNTVVAAGDGQCSITASQPGNTDYAAAKPAMVTVNAGNAPPPTLTVMTAYQGTWATTEGGSVGTGAGASIDGWWCSDDHWCWSTLSSDMKTMTYDWVIQPSDPKYSPSGPVAITSVGAYDNGIAINVAGLPSGGISQTGNTLTGVQVANQTTLSFSFGQNPEWFGLASPANAHAADFQVKLELGHFNSNQGNACNVTLQASVTPQAAALTSYQVSLSAFNVVSNNCGLTGLVPATELANYPIVQVQFAAASVNLSTPSGTVPVNPNAQGGAYTPYSPAYTTEMSVGGPILIQ